MVEEFKPPHEAVDKERELASAWFKRFKEALGKISEDENSTWEDVVDAVWELGLLGPMAPTSDEEYAARDKDPYTRVWSRDDTDLYLSILQGAQALRGKLSPFVTLDGGNITNAVMFTMIDISPSAKQRMGIDDDSEPLPEALLKAVSAKARLALAERGIEEVEPVPVGTAGVLHGVHADTGEKLTVRVRVVHYDDHDGRIRISPASGAGPDLLAQKALLNVINTVEGDGVIKPIDLLMHFVPDPVN